MQILLRPAPVICHNIDGNPYDRCHGLNAIGATVIVIGNKEVCLLRGKRYVGGLVGGVS